MTRKVKIHSAQDLFTIRVMEAKLKELNIPNWVLNKQDSAYGIFGQIELYVEEQDVLRAIKAIQIEEEE